MFEIGLVDPRQLGDLLLRQLSLLGAPRAG